MTMLHVEPVHKIHPLLHSGFLPFMNYAVQPQILLGFVFRLLETACFVPALARRKFNLWCLQGLFSENFDFNVEF